MSGGSDATGKVPLERFAGAVKEVKETTALRINAHVGLMPRAGLGSLVSAGVDAFSVDVYGADSAVQGTLGLQAQANDFLKVVENLKDLGAPVIAPHVCIGIECGRLVGEMRAIGHLRALEAEKVIFIVFTPTKGTPYETAKQPSSADVVSVLERAREELPHARLMLGCMRPRRDRQYEIEALSAGIDGIAMPSEATLKAIRQSGARLSENGACCAMD